MSDVILDVANLSKAYGGVQAVQDVSFSLNSGELLALIGPNGAGKTTCFNMLMGQIRPDFGTVRLKGRDIAGLPPRAGFAEFWVDGGSAAPQQAGSAPAAADVAALTVDPGEPERSPVESCR